MRIELVSRPSQPGCYKCGESQIVAVCHGCGRGMCEVHQGNNEHLFVRNEEFTKLDLQPTEMGEQPVHCAACKHDLYAFHGLDFAFLFLSATLLFWLLFRWRQGMFGVGLWLTYAVTLLLAGIGVIMFMAHYYTYRKQRRRGPPPLPVLGEAAKLLLVEGVQGAIQIDEEGRNKYELNGQRGRFEFHLHFNRRDWTRLLKYRQKYGMAATAQSDISAGVAIACSPVVLNFDLSNDLQHLASSAVVLKQPLENTPFFQGSHIAEDRKWELVRYYTFVHDRFALPVQLLPTLVQDEDQWLLSLLVQPHKMWSGKVDRVTVESLECSVTGTDAFPHKSWPPASVQTGHRQWKAGWQNADLDGNASPPQRTFVLHFPLDGDFPDEILNGSLKVRFHNLLFSGLETVRFFYPLGQENQNVDIHRHSDVYITFQVKLNQLRLYRPLQMRRQEEFAQLKFDDQEVGRLLERLKSMGVSIRGMTESPPILSREQVGLFESSWEISGRAYLGVTPLDFIIVLNSFSPSFNTEQPLPITTRATVIVYSSLVREDVREQGGELRDSLMAAIQGVAV